MENAWCHDTELVKTFSNQLSQDSNDLIALCDRIVSQIDASEENWHDDKSNPFYEKVLEKQKEMLELAEILQEHSDYADYKYGQLIDYGGR